MRRSRLTRQIIDTCLKMTRLGLNQGTVGSISVRYQGGMSVIPTGIPYKGLTEDEIVFIDAGGQHEQGKLPLSEWRSHQATYQARPGAQAVVRNHAVHCTAMSILNQPILTIHYMITTTDGNSIPCTSYATFSTRELFEHIAVALEYHKATPLRHHGPIVYEASLEKTLWLVYEMEVLAQLCLSMLAIIDPVPVLGGKTITVVPERPKTRGLCTEE